MDIVFFVFAIALVMIIVEIKKPGRTWKKVSGWWMRAFFLNLCQVASVFIALLTWDRWFPGKSLWNAEEVLGVTGGALLGYFVITFIYYW